MLSTHIMVPKLCNNWITTNDIPINFSVSPLYICTYHWSHTQFKKLRVASNFLPRTLSQRLFFIMLGWASKFLYNYVNLKFFSLQANFQRIACYEECIFPPPLYVNIQNSRVFIFHLSMGIIKQGTRCLVGKQKKS